MMKHRMIFLIQEQDFLIKLKQKEDLIKACLVMIKVVNSKKIIFNQLICQRILVLKKYNNLYIK